MRKLAFAALSAVIFAGCSTQPTQPTAPIDDKSAAGTSAGPGGASTAGSGGQGVAGSTASPSQDGAASAANVLRDPNNILSKRSVYFEFDSFVVRDEFRPMIEAHARYLADHREARAIVQGNTDDRGSREYNIALGQRRADAVKRMMVLIGAQDAQIETVSFGEEKPRNAGNDESAWTENRRSDILYNGE